MGGKQEELRRLHINELDKASDRIGPTSTDAMEWLLDFAQCEIEALSIGDFSNRSYELASFTSSRGYLGNHYIISEQRWAWIVDQGFTLPSRSQAIEAQKMINTHLIHLLLSRYTRITIEKFKLEVEVTQDRVYLTPSTEYALQYHLATLLGLYGHRIGRCRACERIFLAGRSDKTFCSTRCQSRIATQRFRQTRKVKTKRTNRTAERTSRGGRNLKNKRKEKR